MNLVGENLSYKLTEEFQLRMKSLLILKRENYILFLGRTLSGKTTSIKNNSWITYAR